MNLDRCDDCGSKVTVTADGMYCPVHGEVKIIAFYELRGVKGVERQTLHAAEEGSLP
jgi:hypothetical protein